MNVSWKLLGARRELVARCPEAARSTTRDSQPATRAFTLVELLVTIAIIAILAAALLGASGAAFESARRSRTKTLITKLDSLLMEKYQSFTTRRVDVNTSGTTNGQVKADLRLLGLRELMKLELPDRWSDITNEALSGDPRTVTTTFTNVLSAPPALTQTYLRRLQGLTTGDIGKIQENQSAECLYMIIMFACGDGESADQFSEQDIADTDGDGAPEFVDGWGQPIRFIRWPAGYRISDLMSFDADADHDPFDPFRRDSNPSNPTAFPPQAAYPSNPNIIWLQIAQMRNRNQRANPLTAFRLVPLIFSIGADGDSDVLTDSATTTELDPYMDRYMNGGDNYQLGTTFDGEGDGEGWVDNITNHNLEN